MPLMKYLRCIVIIAVASVAALCSCSSLYDYEGDCEPHYKVRFRFDMNMLYADAFSTQVGEVDLYVIDSEGHVVWSGHEAGDILKSEDYLMDLPIGPGVYDFVAWCRQRHEGASDFLLSGGDAPVDFSGLRMAMEREYDGEQAYSSKDLHALFHGMVSAVELPDYEGSHIVDIPLTKDSNSIRIMLVHLNGEEIRSSDFDFKITDSNGTLGHDNAILDDEPVEYRAWSIREGIAQTDLPAVVGGPSSRAVTEVHSLVAEMTTSRLQTSHRPMLTITRTSDGKKVVNIPLIDYFLMVKGEYNRRMDDDEYLDRQSDYSMTFFMNEDNTWFNAVIDILQWRVVLQNTDL